MFRIELADWARARERAAAIRLAVFVEEQGVPAQIEMDELDAPSVHALAWHGAEAVGTGRLLPDGHIGRMAVLKAWRGRGAGGLILRRLVAAARARGDSAVLLSAQLHALGFYRAHGFEAEGPVYQEAGIAHQAMRLAL